MRNKSTTAVCVHCGDVVLRRYARKVRGYWYCGYCETVVFGNEDKRWIRKISPEDIRDRGFHEI